MKFLLKNLYLLFLCTLITLGFSFSSIQAKHLYSDNIRGEVRGIVTDANNQPLPGVNVFFPQLNRGVATNPNGTYSLKNIPSGTYTLTFSYIGYGSQNKRVTITDGETTTLNVTLKLQALDIATITVTGAAYASDPLTTAADIDVIAGAEKFSSQQASLGASLDQLAGISTISTGSNVGKPVIRGLSGSRVRVLDDGVAMDFQQYGVRHGPNVDPFTAERIEVVRGAASVQYGSDALGGAVNVISNAIPNAIDSEPFLDAQLLGEYAANNAEWTGGLHLDGASGGWGFTGTLVRRSAGNMHAPDVETFNESNDPDAPKFAGELNYTDYDQLNGSIGVGYQGDFGQITTEYTRWQNEHNFLLPNGLGLGQNLENNTYQLKGNFPMSGGFILKPTFTFARNLRQSNPEGANALPREDLPESGRAHLDILLKNYSAKTELKHPKVGPFAGTAGIEYNYQDQATRGEEALTPSGTISNVGAFIFEKAEFNAFTLSIGLRVDHRTQEALPNAELSLPDPAAGETSDVLTQNYTEFSGSIGGTYQFTQHFAVAANVGRGFRAPNFFDLHAYGEHGGVAAFQIGDPNLEPERSLNTDLSFRWRSSQLTAKVTGYRNFISNYIFLVNTGEFTDRDSGSPILRSDQGDARLVGIDASMQAQLAGWLQIDGTFEIVKGKNVDDEIEAVDELPLLPATKLSGGLKFMQEKIGSLRHPYFYIGIEHAFEKQAAGRYEPFWQFGPEFPFGRASTDAYTLVNMSLGFNWPVTDRPISISLQANNILDKAYRDFLDTYKGYALSPGRSISARVKIPFTIL